MDLIEAMRRGRAGWKWRGDGWLRPLRPSEEGTAEVFHCRDGKGPIKKIVSLLTRRFGDEETSVAGASEQRLMPLLGGRLKGANWIVRTQRRGFKRSRK